MCHAYRESVQHDQAKPNELDADKRNIIALPKQGERLKWSGTSVYHLDSIKRVLQSNLPGILHPRRAMLPLLDAQSGAVATGITSLVLDKPYVCGWYGCPVFLTTVKRSEEERTNEDTEYVVLKLMYMDARERGENISMDDFDFINAKALVDFAKAEADAYAALEKAQGSIVPYCYGFYEFTLANGHRCIGMVLEHISAMDPKTLCQSFAVGVDDRKISAFLENLYLTLIELHKAGVLHKDQACRNMRVLYPVDPIRPRFLIFDFGYSQIASEWDTKKELWSPTRGGEDDWLRMDRYRVAAMLRECGEAVEKSPWLLTERGKQLVRLWKTHPDDLSEEQKEPAWYKPVLDQIQAKL